MNTMKKHLVKGLSILACAGLFLGCTRNLAPNIVIRDIDKTKRAPTESVDVFTHGETPKRDIKDIAEFSYEATFGNTEELALDYFIPEAKKRGAQLIMTESHVSHVVQHGDFGRETFYVVKARVAVYK